MKIEIREEPISYLDKYGQISIAFKVERILELGLPGGVLGGFMLRERLLLTPYLKDYDSIAGNHPTDWARTFDTSNWGLLLARSGREEVGGAVIAHKTPNLNMLENRNDLAVLWDLRVSPECRGMSIGSALFEASEVWAGERGCLRLKIETQNINVPACKFYAKMGCHLGAINRFAYPELPDEIQLLWYKNIQSQKAASSFEEKETLNFRFGVPNKL